MHKSFKHIIGVIIEWHFACCVFFPPKTGFKRLIMEKNDLCSFFWL